MANNKKYISLNRLSNFLDNLKTTFALMSHKHTTADITDYKVDDILSSTSANPVANRVLDAEFEAISTAMNSLELAIDGKADSTHDHNSIYYQKTYLDSALSNKSDKTHNHDAAYSPIDHNHDGVYSLADHNHDSKYEPKGTASSAVSTHNTSTSAHNDIRLSITELTTKLNNFLDVDDTTTDQLSELLTLIENNATDIESITNGKVNVSDIVNNLTTNVDNKPLSAAQGVAIKSLIDDLQIVVDGKADLVHTHPYGVCSSSATYITKTVTVENFSLVEGVRVIVKFTNANKASSPKLNVNGTGAIPIMCYGETAVGSNIETNSWEAGAILAFTYDGTNWVRDYWYNTTYTNAKLGQGYGTCSTATSTAEKEVSMTGYEDKTGGIVSIKFTYSVDAGATLNINGQGALDIYYNGSAIVDDVIKGGDIATFINSGSSYRLISVDRWHEDIVALQASESKVKQMETIANGNFPILLAPSDINGTDYRYTYYADGIYANPNIGKIYADISGNAGSASKLTDDSAEKIQLNYGGTQIVSTSGTGAAYTATIDGMAELKTGARITIVPHTNSTSTTATLDVNGLGAKQIRTRLSTNTTTTSVGYSSNWIISGKPLTLTYNGTYWVTDYARPDANTIYGTVPVKLGGTGKTTVTSGNLLVGNGTEELEEMTPEEVLSHINGASVMTMTTAEYEALSDDETNANTLYMLTDADDNDNQIYVNNEAPANAEEGALWLDLDEEPAANDDNITKEDVENALGYTPANVKDVFENGVVANFTNALVSAGIEYGKRINIDNGEIEDTTGTLATTGLIPIEPNSIIRVNEDFPIRKAGGAALLICDVNKDVLKIYPTESIGVNTYYTELLETDENGNIISFKINKPSSAKYIRLCNSTKLIGRNPVLTVNEEITYTMGYGEKLNPKVKVDYSQITNDPQRNCWSILPHERLNIAYSNIGRKPSNTVEHFTDAATNFNYNVLKCDVRPTSDGELVCCHDAGFTFNEEGYITSYDASNSTVIHDVTAETVLGYSFKTGEHPCLVGDYLDVCRTYEKVAFITIRNEYMSVVIPKLLAELKAHNMTHSTIINSMSYDSLAQWRTQDKEVMLNYTLELGSEINQKEIDRAIGLGYCLLSGFSLSRELNDPSTPSCDFEYARANGVRLLQAIAYEESSVEACYALGYDGCTIGIPWNPIGDSSDSTSIDVTASVGQTIVVEEVDGNGKPTKWKAADYQEKICGKEELVFLENTDLEFAFMDEMGAYVAMVPSNKHLTSGEYKVTFNGTTYENTATDEVLALGNVGLLEGGEDTGEPYIIFEDSEAGIMVLCFAEISTATLSITTIGVKTIDNKYLPEVPFFDLYALGDLREITSIQLPEGFSDFLAQAYASGMGRLRAWIPVETDDLEYYNVNSCDFNVSVHHVSNNKIVLNAMVKTSVIIIKVMGEVMNVYCHRMTTSNFT